MFEIELKAHVDNYESSKKTISSFANALGKTYKSDVYWNIENHKNQNPIKIRIREECTENTQGKKSITTIVTYKRKELRNTCDSVSYEVNDEQEFHIDNRKAFETVLIDTGFEIDFIKEKHVLQWEHDGVLLELCTITGLGDFLELEITQENRNEAQVQTAIKKLQGILLQCGIPLENIEKRYYSELLQEKK